MSSLVSMPEIARLADVTRQAVTNWRSRPGVAPFPAPAAVERGLTLFDRDEVVDWLELTGRGRNPEARLDAPAQAGADLDVNAAVTLLGLRAAAGEDMAPLSVAQRMEAAVMADPADLHLQSEAIAHTDDDRLVGYVDELFSASFGPSDALQRLDDTRPARGSRGFAPELVDLLQQLAQACRTHLGVDGVAVDLSTPERHHQIGAGFDSVTAGEDTDRTLLTRLVLTGAAVVTAAHSVVRIVSTVGMDTEAALDAADHAALSLTDGEVLLVVGPARALCDRLSGDLYELRRRTVELGTLVAAFKLPRGLWLEAHRHSLGLWVLRGGRQATGVAVADLSGRELNAAELADDVFGALAQSPARAYRYARVLPYAETWTRDTVVPAGILAAEPTVPRQVHPHDRIIEATLITREPLPGFDIPVTRAVASTAPGTRTISALIEAKAIKLLRGTRFASEHLDAAGSVEVLTAAGPAGRIDPLVAAAHYDHAARTEPGDVIFTATPNPRARVDTEGGARVSYPSRILRIDPYAGAGIGSHALAACINETVVGPEWRTWRIPTIAPDQIAVLEATLSRAAAHLEELERRHNVLTGALTDLIHGVTQGFVTLAPPTTRKVG